MTQGSHTRQEIASQPQIWQATLDKFAADRAALAAFIAGVGFEQAVVIGCGSTHYLSQTAAAILSHCGRVRARPLPASELWLYPGAVPAGRTLLLAVSRSGATTETVRAVARFREVSSGPVVAVTCHADSPLAQQADFVLAAPAAQEVSVAQTRSFTSMLVLSQALAATVGRDEGMVERLYRLPKALHDLMGRLDNLPERLGADGSIQRFFFLGGGPLHGLACEAMLKTKEMSLSYAEAYYPLEFRHGPMSMVDGQTLVVGLLSDAGLAEELGVLRHMQGLGARTLALVDDVRTLAGWQPDYTIELRSGLNEWERGPLCLPALQLTAFHRALHKGLNPDQPHNLTAVVTL